MREAEPVVLGEALRLLGVTLVADLEVADPDRVGDRATEDPVGGPAVRLGSHVDGIDDHAASCVYSTTPRLLVHGRERQSLKPAPASISQTCSGYNAAPL